MNMKINETNKLHNYITVMRAIIVRLCSLALAVQRIYIQYYSIMYHVCKYNRVLKSYLVFIDKRTRSVASKKFFTN
jgi:hypothetical protein